MILSVGALIVCRCFVYACIHDVVCELILSSPSSVTPLCSHRKSFVAAASLGGRLAVAVRTTLSLLISRHKHKTHLSKALTCQPLPPPQESCWWIWAPQHITLLPSLNFSLWKKTNKQSSSSFLLVVILLLAYTTTTSRDLSLALLTIDCLWC